MMEKRNWTSFHLYYAEPWEALLRDFLKPWTEKHIGESELFFFIRYWEKGPHIRFRMAAEPTRIQSLSHELHNAFERYIEANPSERNLEAFQPEDKDFIAKEWHPNNSIQAIDYEPEVSRYGGNHGLAISEQHFKYSSKYALEAIADDEEWDYNSAFAAALQAHVLMCKASGMSKADMQRFFYVVCMSWYPRASRVQWEALTQEEQQDRKEEIFKAYEQQFRSQEANIKPYVLELLSSGDKDLQEGIEDYAFSWYQSSRNIASQLESCYKRGNLEDPGWIKSILGNEIPDHQKATWAIYSSYVHMTNNRLGLDNSDEGFLAYVIMGCLKD